VFKTDTWAPLLRGLREPEPDEDADAAMDAEWEAIMDDVREGADAHDAAGDPPPSFPREFHDKPPPSFDDDMGADDDEYVAGVSHFTWFGVYAGEIDYYNYYHCCYHYFCYYYYSYIL
jgi:hypothetical protein